MSEKINLPELAGLLAQQAGISKKEAESFLKETFDALSESLIQGKSVKIKGLGSFKLISVNDRGSIDVTTGNRVLIPAHYKVNFSPDTDFAQAVNEPFSLFEPVELAAETETETNLKLKPPSVELPKASPAYFEPVDIKRSHKNKRWISVSLCILVLLLIGGGIYLFDESDNDMIFTYSEEIIPETTITKEVIPETNTIETVITETVTEPQIVDTVKKRTIQNGERLTTIALDEYGDKTFWIYLYEENKSILKDPNRVTVGQTIVIPPAEKYGINKGDETSIEKAKGMIDQLIQ